MKYYQSMDKDKHFQGFVIAESKEELDGKVKKAKKSGYVPYGKIIVV